MNRRWTMLMFATLPLLSATAGVEVDCSPFGWFVHEVNDSRGNPDPYRFTVIYRLRPNGVAPIAAHQGLRLCPGDVLETWHGATTTLVRGNNVASVVAEGGSVLHFSDRIVQQAGTVTYLMPSGWRESVEATLKDGALLVSSMFSTVQVSMSGPSCDPTVEVSVSALDDPFTGNSTTPNPSAHGARLTRLDAMGRPRGQSLELHGDESAQLPPDGKLPVRGEPMSDAAYQSFQRMEPRLRVPLTQRGPPTDEERQALTPSERRLVVYADVRPAVLRLNGLNWSPWGWFSVVREGEKRWEAARMMRLPPGQSVVEVTLSDGRQGRVMTPATGAIVVDLRERKELQTPPVQATSVSTAATVVLPCGIPILGWPTGETYIPDVADLYMHFVGLSEGQFCMGSQLGVGDEDEHPQHPVKVSAFLMGESEVTQAQWRRVVEAAKARGDADAAMLNADPSYAKGATRPVEQVSWCDVVRFANALSRLDDRSPAYEITESCAVRWVDGANGYRLPTEAEWEFAARAGTTTNYASGDDEADLARVGWYGSNSGSKTHDVCTTAEKPWGLCDLHGNLWEWVFDTYDSEVYASRGPTLILDPGHPMYDVGGSSAIAETAHLGFSRVVRGGSWYYKPTFARSANRYRLTPSSTSWLVGFRLVLSTSAR